MSDVMIVTGGSRGIGAATARLAGARGYHVCVNYLRDEKAAVGVVNDIEKAGGTAKAVQGNVASEDEILKLFKTADAMGPLKVLINNAGVVDVSARVEDMSWDRLARQMNINVIGSFICAREAVKRMSTRHGHKGGAIINLSSAAAWLSSPNQYVDYAAAKAAVNVLTHGLALEVAQEGIRVNAVAPGLIDTDIHASGGLPDRVRDLRGLVPMKREGTADEVAATIMWLVSDEASYITGDVVKVAGGR